MKLEWEQNPPEELMTWSEANEYVKSLGDGWRLPTKEELKEAYDSKVEGFKPKIYWSSSTYAPSTIFAWYVGFYYGNVGVSNKAGSYYVRCVREVI